MFYHLKFAKIKLPQVDCVVHLTEWLSNPTQDKTNHNVSVYQVACHYQPQRVPETA